MSNSILLEEGLCFDDVLLVPRRSSLASRSEVRLDTSLGHINLSVPIISANMDTITGYSMAKAMHQSGALGILHRYVTSETICTWIENLIKDGAHAVPSIGVQYEDFDKAIRYREVGAEAICIDVAHGHSDVAISMVQKISKELDFKTIIAGNVATADGALDLAKAGANVIKVGIGPGSMCTTRVQTGHGVPQLTAIAQCADIKRDYPIKIIADGGLRNSGDMVKALAAGADALMSGSLFAGCTEVPRVGVGLFYRGMASKEAQMDFRGKVNNDAPEGESITVQDKGKVVNVLQGLIGGLRSGFSYSGSKNLAELHEVSKFMKVSYNTAKENIAHGKY